MVGKRSKGNRGRDKQSSGVALDAFTLHASAVARAVSTQVVFVIETEMQRKERNYTVEESTACAKSEVLFFSDGT